MPFIYLRKWTTAKTRFNFLHNEILNINISTNERMDFTWLFSTPIWSYPYIVHDLQLFELDFTVCLPE